MKKFDPIAKNFPHMLIGGDYNPDQWVDYPEILAKDMELMREANCNEMTLGIFSWDTIEPREGEFDFSLLDERMDAIYQNGGRVILATGTPITNSITDLFVLQKYLQDGELEFLGIQNFDSWIGMFGKKTQATI